MIIRENTRKDNSKTFSFRYYNSEGTRKTVLKESYGGSAISSYEQALLILPALEKKFESHKNDNTKELYTAKIAEFVQHFTKWKKKKAPASWKPDISYLENRVFKYFLDKKQLFTLAEWPQFFDDFTLWLDEEKNIKGESLSVSAKNTIITVTNQFLDVTSRGFNLRFMYRPLERLESINNISLEDLPTDEETEIIYKKLRKKNELFSDFYYLLRHTGLRINEAIGISYNMIRMPSNFSKLEEVCFKTSEVEPKLKIVLNSQPSQMSRAKSSLKTAHGEFEYGNIVRKPLKKKKSLKEFRIVLVFDDRCTEIIKKYTKKAQDLFDKKTYGDDAQNYGLFFDEFVVFNFREALHVAYIEAELEYKSPHKLRHAFATWAYEIFTNDKIVMETMGHTMNASKRYNHLIEQKAKSSLNEDLIRF